MFFFLLELITLQIRPLIEYFEFTVTLLHYLKILWPHKLASI